MRETGQEYAVSVIENARTLARGLHVGGGAVIGADRGYTDSHTVLVRTDGFSSNVDWGQVLDQHDIIANTIQLPEQLGGRGLRFGVSELTRRGADIAVMQEIATIILDVLFKRSTESDIKYRVHSLAARIRTTDPFA
jgi:glycine/serine hydroxymethyltransferase